MRGAGDALSGLQRPVQTLAIRRNAWRAVRRWVIGRGMGTPEREMRSCQWEKAKMKATLIALTALSLFMGATPVSARDYGRRDRDYSWRDYDCRRYYRLTDRHAAGLATIYHGRLYPGDVIVTYGWRGGCWAPFI
jgi:hypothetical protein